MHAGISVHEISVCIKGFACPRMHTGIDLDPCVHTGITCHAIPVCIRGFSCDPPIHTGICVIPVCIQGLILIPVCIRGLNVMQSPYAYGDPHMHTGIDFDPRMLMGITRSDWLTPW